jgi:hypothetical protein
LQNVLLDVPAQNVRLNNGNNHVLRDVPAQNVRLSKRGTVFLLVVGSDFHLQETTPKGAHAQDVRSKNKMNNLDVPQLKKPQFKVL